VVRVFNGNKNQGNFIFALKGARKSTIVVSVKVNSNPLDYKLEKSYEMYSDPLIEFGLYRYNTVKDPPPIGTW